MSGENVLLIAGASVRAAAFSALRGGFKVSAADLFADADLQRACDCYTVDPYPDRLTEIFKTAPPGAWMYTGALENYPRLLASLARQRRLLGCSAEVVRRVRDPRELHESLTSAGFASPAIFTHGSPPRDARRWLCKRRRSAGGLGIEFFSPDKQGNTSLPAASYLQEFAPGMSCGLAYVAAGGQATFLGASRQLTGRRWCGAQQFMYCGSLAPQTLASGARSEAVRLGRHLAAAFGLTGLFGVDVILHNNRLWVLEVNPRFTSSLEVLERLGDYSAVALHMQACQAGRLPAREPAASNPPAAPTRFSGKAIVYARRDALVGASFQRFVQSRLDGGQIDSPPIADIPPLGSSLIQGRPICTVLADGESAPAVLRQLRSAAKEVFAALAKDSV